MKPSSGWFVNKIAKTFEEVMPPRTHEFRLLIFFSQGIAGLSWETHPQAQAELQRGEVRVEVKACALNFFDLLTLVGRYQVPLVPPFCVTSEGAGVVTESNSPLFQVGDEVVGMAFGFCQQHCLASDDSLVRKPARLSWTQAAGAWIGWITAYHGLVQRGHVRAGEVVVVTGAAGGMGTIAIALAKERGCRVVAVVSTESKRAVCSRVGADEVVVLDTDAKKWSAQLKAACPSGIDVAYEVVGGELFHVCSRLMTSGGRLLVIGFAGGEIPAIKTNLPLVKGYSVVGVRSGTEVSATRVEEGRTKWSSHRRVGARR